MRRWWNKLAQLVQRRPVLDDELRDEIQSHLDLLTDEREQLGLPHPQARQLAQRDLGNATLLREQAREAWRFPRMESFLQDIRYGLRGMRKAPGFSLAVILTLALGIGVNTAVFSVVYAVLLRPLPYPSSERLVQLGESSGQASGISVTWINFTHWRAENHSFEKMAGTQMGGLTLTGRGDALQTRAGLVTGDFFPLTGSRPVLGRLFTADDDHAGAPPVVLLSYEFWAKVFSADPNVVGGALTLNGRSSQVVGVLRPGLKFFPVKTDVYLPLGPSASQTVKRSEHGSMRVLALLKPGVTLAAARADLDGIMQRLAIADPGPENDHRASLTSLLDAVTGSTIRPILFLLLGAVALILILVCANVSSLLLVRGTVRVRELALRAALGAGTSRLARQLLTENLVLAVLGGLTGVFLAAVCLRLLVLSGPSSIPRLAEVRLDLPVLGFASLISLVVGLLAGFAPIRNARRLDLTTALKEGSAQAGAGARGRALRNGLVIAEIAVTFVLAFSASLLLRSLVAAQSVYPGFDSDHLLTLQLQLPDSSYRDDARIRHFYDQLLKTLRSEPGIQSAGLVTCPLDDCGDYWYSVAGRPAPARANVPLTLFKIADSTYFQTMHMRLKAGRGFTDIDREASPPVTVINEVLARRWWAAPQQALGQQIKFGGPYMTGPLYEIVGVVGAVHQMGLDQPPEPELYIPFAQQPSAAMTVVIRTAGDPGSISPVVRRVVRSLDRNLPIQALQPLESSLASTLDRRRFSASLLSSFAILALTLAALGVYGVLNYWVNVRQKEIAVRLALGAQRSGILYWAGSHAGRLTVAGLSLGALGSWAAAHFLNELVFGVSTHSPVMILTAVLVVLATTVIAVSLPLWRASATDPIHYLHNQ